MSKFPATAKRRVTRQWHEGFPNFDVWRPLRLLRRIGPVLQGITLDIISNGYRPTAHVHALVSDFPVVALSLEQCLVTENGADVFMPTDSDEVAVAEAAGTLRAQSNLSLDRHPALEEVLAEYRRHLEVDPYAGLAWRPDIDDMVLISAFSANSDSGLDKHVAYVRELASTWVRPPDGFDSKDAWLADLTERASDLDALKERVEANARELKADSLADRSSA